MEETLDNRFENIVAINLSERELFLIKWSLESMARNNLKTGSLRYDIDSLRSKLAMKCIRGEMARN